jgi:predicted nucleotidyltransferase
MNFMGLQEYLEEAFATRVDLVTEGAVRDRLRARIEAEAMRVA